MKKLKYADIFWVFILGSLVGFVLEGVWHFIRKGSWESHTATVWGPFCIIYGIGAVVLYALGIFIEEKNVFIVFLISALVGSAIELISGIFQELAFGTYSWDYHSHVLNIGGKVSLKMGVMWGVLGTVFVKCMVPHINTFLDMLQGGGWDAAVVCLSVFMAVNLSVTGAALVRWKYRAEGEAPSNAVERMLDENFGDEKMKKIFPNMKRLS